MQNFSSEAATGGGAGFWGAPPVQMAPIPRPRRGGRRQSLVDPVANAEFEAHLNHEMGGFFARATKVRRALPASAPRATVPRAPPAARARARAQESTRGRSEAPCTPVTGPGERAPPGDLGRPAARIPKSTCVITCIQLPPSCARFPSWIRVYENLDTNILERAGGLGWAAAVGAAVGGVGRASQAPKYQEGVGRPA